MHRVIKPIFWSFLFLVILLAIDQFFVQVPPVHPAHAAVSNFYRDFRNRLIDLTFGEKTGTPQSIEAIIEKQQATGDTKPQSPPAPAVEPPPEPSPGESPGAAPRYVYVDGQGELHFADSLDEVPEPYRAQAQPMGQ